MIACEQIVLENKIDKITHKHLFFTINFFLDTPKIKKKGGTIFLYFLFQVYVFNIVFLIQVLK